MAIKQMRIWVPAETLFNDINWANTLIGRVIKPLVEKEDHLKWFWFSKYCAEGKDNPVNTDDDSIQHIPDHFGVDQNGITKGKTGFFRSLRFRFEILEEALGDFKNKAIDILKGNKCEIAKWEFKKYDLEEDLGGDRFLGGDHGDPRREERRKERMFLVAEQLHSLSKIYIHTLEGPDSDGKFQCETNDHGENPNKSTYDSLHHMFCNLTSTPITSLFYEHPRVKGSIVVKTHWMPGSFVVSFR